MQRHSHPKEETALKKRAVSAARGTRNFASRIQGSANSLLIQKNGLSFTSNGRSNQGNMSKHLFKENRGVSPKPSVMIKKTPHQRSKSQARVRENAVYHSAQHFKPPKF